jgi:phage shock protein E
MGELNRILYVMLILMIIPIAGLSSSAYANDMTKPLIIDARTTQEWDSGHIEGAVLIPYEQIGKGIGSVAKDKSQRIYVYCRTGRRSTIAKKTLDKLGYKDVVNLGSLENAARILKLKIIKH